MHTLTVRGYFTDGKKLIWEYPRLKSDGEQMDFVESMELNDQGLIQHHAVYWGWRGVKVMLADAYRACCPNRDHNNVVLMVTDLLVYGSHDERRGLAGSHLELSSQFG